jgi:hypothetical protein
MYKINTIWQNNVQTPGLPTLTRLTPSAHTVQVVPVKRETKLRKATQRNRDRSEGRREKAATDQSSLDIREGETKEEAKQEKRR